MNLEEAKRGFQQELSQRRAGEEIEEKARAEVTKAQDVENKRIIAEMSKLTPEEARFGNNPTVPKEGVLANTVDLVKLKQLNEVSVPTEKTAPDGRKIVPLQITDAQFKQMAINHTPVMERERVAQELEKLSPEGVRLVSVLKNQATLVNDRNVAQGAEKKFDVANLNSRDITNLLVSIGAKTTRFEPQKIGSTNIIDTSYNKDPRSEKISGPLSLPLLGKFDKNIQLVPATLDTPEKRRDMLMNLAIRVYGLPKNQAAAIVGNAAVEGDTSWRGNGKGEKFDLDATDGLNEGSLGLFQHRLDRLKGMKKFADEEKPGIDGQLSYALAELDGSSIVPDSGAKKVGDAFKANPNMSVEEATKLFQNNFERPKSKTESLARRTAEAKSALVAYENDVSGESSPAPVIPGNDTTEKPGLLDPKQSDAPIVKKFKEVLNTNPAIRAVVNIFGWLDSAFPSSGAGKQQNNNSYSTEGKMSEYLHSTNTPISINVSAENAKDKTQTQNAEAVFQLLTGDTVPNFRLINIETSEKERTIRRMETTISGVTYTLEYQKNSSTTLSPEIKRENTSLRITTTRNISGTDLEFAYTDRERDGTLDVFSADTVQFSGVDITPEMHRRFTEELQTLAQLYYNAL
jgi:hypothetical protein